MNWAEKENKHKLQFHNEIKIKTDDKAYDFKKLFFIDTTLQTICSKIMLP